VFRVAQFALTAVSSTKGLSVWPAGLFSIIASHMHSRCTRLPADIQRNGAKIGASATATTANWNVLSEESRVQFHTARSLCVAMHFGPSARICFNCLALSLALALTWWYVFTSVRLFGRLLDCAKSFEATFVKPRKSVNFWDWSS